MQHDDAAFLRVLIASAPTSAAEVLTRNAELEAAFVEELRVAEAQWPCALPRAELARELAARMPDDCDEAVLAKMSVADLRLACACVHGVHGAQARLRELHLGDVRRGLGRQPDAATTDELVQEVFRHVLVAEHGGAIRLANYSGRGALGRWLSVVARRIALDRARSNKDQSAALDEGSIAAAYGDPELTAMKQTTRDAFRAAIEAAAAALQPRDRNMLRYVFVHNLAIEEVAGIYRVSRSTAYRQLTAVREGLVARVRDQMSRQLGIALEDLDRELAQMHSAIAVTLSRILKSPRS